MKTPLLPYRPAVFTSAPGYLKMRMKLYRQMVERAKKEKK